jgi:hypothetical protein
MSPLRARRTRAHGGRRKEVELQRAHFFLDYLVVLIKSLICHYRTQPAKPAPSLQFYVVQMGTRRLPARHHLAVAWCRPSCRRHVRRARACSAMDNK